jgi:hypothetical protein
MEPSNALRFTLQDRINDAAVGPSHVPLALLGQFQREVEDFLKGSGREIDPNQVVVSIEDGSLAIVASGLLAATSLWADLGQLQSPSTLEMIDPKRAAVVEGWQKAARKHPHRSYALVNKDSKLDIRVDAISDFRNQVEAAWMAVEKYLQGTVVNWGGATKANVHLRLDAGHVLTISASQQLLADEEQNRLYRPALLRVSAEESLKTGELRNLVLLGFEAHQPVWDEAEFNKLVQKGTQAWADVPDSWLEDLRSGPG